ncbi:MAG: MoxR family ATPase [Planctomycetota bacterium]
MTTTPTPTQSHATGDRERVADRIRAIETEARRVIVGQDAMLRGLLIGLLTGGHVLLEGLPGLAKTLTVNALARAVDAKFSRIQFTPDLLPADLIGTLIYSPKDGAFTPRLGPIFANVVLADEINRAPAKVQSALLEAMQERRATVGETTHDLPAPFLVLATQNPIEQEGTYPLPEAQVDRFLLKLVVGYPTREDERLIVDRSVDPHAMPERVEPVATPADILRAQELTRGIMLPDAVRDYIVDLVFTTREPGRHADALGGLIEVGASPRASIALALASRAQALLEGRGTVTPSDVKAVALEVLRHRVVLSFEGEAEGLTPDDVVRRVLDLVRVPT